MAGPTQGEIAPPVGVVTPTAPIAVTCAVAFASTR